MIWFLLLEDRRGFFKRVTFDALSSARNAYEEATGPNVVAWLRGVLVTPLGDRDCEFVCDAVDFVSDDDIDFHCGPFKRKAARNG